MVSLGGLRRRQRRAIAKLPEKITQGLIVEKECMQGREVSVWCVSDGRAGIERQTLAVAHALRERVPTRIKVLRLQPSGFQLVLPPSLWPMPKAALPIEQAARLQAPWPDVWIANGRRSIPYSLRMKKWSTGHSLVVQLQNPRLKPKRFDLVAPPKHDLVRGDNVITTLGAPVWYSQKEIETNLAQIPEPRHLGKKKVMVILGGKSKRHRLSLARAHAILAELQRLAYQEVHLMITTSRRTPKPAEDLFRAFAFNSGADFFANEARDGPNPYLAWLAQAEAALVTEDSTNMMTDVAFFGIPMHLIKLEGRDTKFDRLHAAFIERGAARWFGGSLTSWTYEPIRDAMEIAEAIQARLIMP
jgi:mitochondrial fission protein ELM1